MNTFLGACVSFGPGDLDEAMIADSGVTYLEGYLFDPPAGPGRVPACGRRGARGRAQGGAVAVRRVLRGPAPGRVPRAGGGHVDILFANEAEICSLYEKDTFEAAAALAAADVAWRR